MGLDLATYRLRRETGDTFRMVFGLGRTPRTVSGIQKLAQLVSKMLLTTPGSDKFEPTVGGGILRLFLQPLDSDDASEVQEALTIAVGMVEDKILETQEAVSLPSDERLSELRLDQLTFDDTTQEWTFVVRMISEAGTTFRLDLSSLLEKEL